MTIPRLTPWWDVVGWLAEFAWPVWRPVYKAAHRRGVHLCRCLVMGHRWRRTPQIPYVVAVCDRACCRGCDRHGVMRHERHPGRPDVSSLFKPGYGP